MENNGRGVFYGVIGVATLIVAIIGATFAYFSASANTGYVLEVAGAEMALAADSVTTGYKPNLIPVDETLETFPDAVGIGTQDCVDLNGNNFCSVYSFSVKNTSTTSAQKVYGSMVISTNEFMANTAAVDGKCSTAENGGEVKYDATEYCGKTNLSFAIFRGTPNDEVNTPVTNFDVDADASVTAFGSLNDGKGAYGDMIVRRTAIPAGTTEIDLPALDMTLSKEQEVWYTIVFWIHETGANQNADQGATFSGGINFTTEGSGSGVTAILSADQASSRS